MKYIIKNSIWKLDITIWIITILFFIISAFFYSWNITNSVYWSIWIILLMLFVSISIEMILISLKNIKWLWTITWFITNWPEALVLVVWLISWNIIFAASTPLWSNFVNPILLLLWIILMKKFNLVLRYRYKYFFLIWFILTSILALTFFFIWEKHYLLWLWISLIISFLLFFRKLEHHEIEIETEIEIINVTSKILLPVWILILLFSWYFLDPIVWFTAEASKTPKWVIWFLVLSTLTSWPEFKSVLSLLKKWKLQDSFVNILVSNITNLWLAIVWIIVWYFTK